MKRILIDARIFGTQHTGIGRYVQNLITQISLQNKNYDITLLINDKNIRNIFKDKFKYIETNIKHYSFAEQIKLPLLLYRYNFDLVHFTHFNKPILYILPSVITIHDLIKNFFYGKETTTRLGPLYWIKYLFYRIFTYLNIKNNYIIVPSNYWRDYILKTYNLSPRKIVTTYESIDPVFKKQKPVQNPLPYIVYTGNLYPHKNINVVLEALKQLPKIKLKVICKPGIFQQRLKKLIDSQKIKKQVEFLGHLSDTEFAKIYQKAIALVHPSLMEGFSLTGLEAMALSCPVISSNASCLPEIYDTSVLYFDPHDPIQLVTQINKLQSPEVRIDYIKRGTQHIRLFSWVKTAQLTLNYYDQILK